MANFVAHFAIYADDLDRAMNFHREVFGWSFEAWGPPDFYLIDTGDKADPGATHGALEKRAEPLGDGGLAAYRCTISVDSVEETMAAIEIHGGRFRSALFEIPGVGRVVEFEDTEGNVVCAMEYVIDDLRSAKRSVATFQKEER